MRKRPYGPSQLTADPVIAVGAVAIFGSGLVLVLFGLGGGERLTSAIGGLFAAVALVILLSGNWLNGLAVIALSLPLPAIYNSSDLRVSLAAPITAAVVFGWFLQAGLEGTPLRLGKLPVRATAALLSVFAVATLFAQRPLVSLREFINFGILIALFVAATAGLTQNPHRARPLVRLLVVLGAACGVLGVLEAVNILPGNFPRWGTSWNRAALGFGQPNALGLFLAVLLPLAAHRATAAASLVERAAARIAVLAIFAGLFATFSRGSWLAVLAGASALFLTGDRRTVLRIWLIAIALAVVVDVLSGGMLRDTFQRTVGDWVIEQRAALMLAGILMFLDHPYLGVGPGGFAPELDRYGPQIAQLWDYLDTPHNAYVQMAAETGLVGLCIFVVFLGTLLRVMVRGAVETPPDMPEVASFRRALVWSFATACCAGLVVWPFAHGTGQAIVLIAAMGAVPMFAGVPASEPDAVESCERAP